MRENKSNSLKEGLPEEKNAEIDFYKENGLYVFTAFYHKKRGFCCKSGCRHCPYGYKK